MDLFLLAGLAAGLGTCMGALIVIIMGRVVYRFFPFLIGMAAGVMSAVILFDLTPAAFQCGNATSYTLGAAGGIIFMTFLDYFVNFIIPSPGTHFHYLKMGLLIAFGISIHDIPEGLAIAAGFTGPLTIGTIIAFSIGIHNIPEGMAIAAPLLTGGMKPVHVALLNLFISFATPLGCYLGLILFNISPQSVSVTLSFAAGAMTYLVIKKLLPESRRHGPIPSNTGIFTGVAVILALNLLS